MEDYILREINNIGKVIEAIFLKIVVIKKTNYSIELMQSGMTALQEKLDLDVDAVLEDGKMVDILIVKYGFTDENLERFAELLFEFFTVSNNDIEKEKYKMRISEIYKYLEENGKTFSIDRFYISRELNL